MKNYLSRNAKMVKSGPGFYNWGIPAFRNKDGFVTCPGAGMCVKGCYAQPGQGFYGRSWVAKAYEERLALSRSPQFKEVIDAEIKRRKVKVLRVHDSGDFYSEQYMADWRLIAAANPWVKFYSYTKNLELVFKHFWPDNWVMILSEGGKHDHLINRAVHRHARVFVNECDIVPAGYANATHDDSVAVFGKNHRIGLAYHGTHKSRAFQTGHLERGELR